MTTPTDTIETHRRYGIILLEARPGWLRAARGLVGRALRQSLGIKSWHSDPHFVTYWKEGALDEDGGGTGGMASTARFTGDFTDAEFDAFLTLVFAMAKAEGWDSAPVDCYHD